MESNPASLPERGGIGCWKMEGKENIPGCKTVAGFWWSREPTGSAFLGEYGDCLINPSFCSIFRKNVREKLKEVIQLNKKGECEIDNL